MSCGYVALLHPGSYTDPEFHPGRDFVACARVPTLPELREAYRAAGADPAKVARVRGAVLILTAQFAVAGLAHSTAGAAWKLVRRSQQALVGDDGSPRAKPPRKPGKARPRAVPGPDLDRISAATERHRRARRVAE